MLECSIWGHKLAFPKLVCVHLFDLERLCVHDLELGLGSPSFAA